MRKYLVSLYIFFVYFLVVKVEPSEVVVRSIPGLESNG